MAFTIKKKTSFFWPVTIKTPGDGQFEEQNIELEFKYLKNSEIVALFDKIKNYSELCKKVVIGWKNVKDDDEKDVPFSPAAFDAFLDNSNHAASVVEQYLKIVGGVVEKN